MKWRKMELDCGIRRDRIVAWLDDELGLGEKDGTWAFEVHGKTCRITLAPLENRIIGKFDLQRTLVTFEGDDDAIARLYRLFTLRFMSAGG